MAKSAATEYSDYFNNNSKTPGASTTEDDTITSQDSEETDPRKIAIKRRLKLAKKVRR